MISFTEFGDFNGDGFIDFLNRVHTQGGTYSIGYIVSLNNGAGAFTQRTYPIGGLDSYNDRPLGDFNGDGKTDFIRINNAVQSGRTPTIFNDTQFTVKTNVCGKVGQTKIVDFDRISERIRQSGDHRTDAGVFNSTEQLPPARLIGAHRTTNWFPATMMVTERRTERFSAMVFGISAIVLIIR